MESVPCPKCEGVGSVKSWPDRVRCDWCNGLGWEWAACASCTPVNDEGLLEYQEDEYEYEEN